MWEKNYALHSTTKSNIIEDTQHYQCQDKADNSQDKFYEKKLSHLWYMYIFIAKLYIIYK